MTSLDTVPAGFSGDYSAGQLWLHRIARRTARTFGIGAALTAVIGVVLGAASLMVPDRAAPQAGGGDAWSDVNHPLQMFAMVGTEFAKLPSSYSAQRGTGGGRRDLLTFGSLRGDSPFLQLSFYRMGREAEPATSFVRDLDRIDPVTRATATRISGATSLDTRFGPFEAADLRLVSDQLSAPCLGFRSKPVQGEVLRISGLACGASGRPVGRDLLGCVIDRIDILSAGSDAALKNLLVEAERRRGSGCAPAPSISAGAARITWLDATASPPPLKGLSAEPRLR